MPAMAVNMSAAVIVGNLLGAGDSARAKMLGLWLIGVGALVMTGVAAIIWPFRQDLAALLAQDAGVQAQAVCYLEYNLISTPFSVASMVLGGIMTGAGATIYTFCVYSSATWLVRLPLAYFLGHILWQTSSGVFFSMLVGQLAQSSLLLYIFERKDWPRFSMIKRRVKE